MTISVAKYKGSVSAEHGLGFVKRKNMKYSKSEAAYNTMKGIKQLMDPKVGYIYTTINMLELKYLLNIIPDKI